jgi:hypothetical protein
MIDVRPSEFFRKALLDFFFPASGIQGSISTSARTEFFSSALSPADGALKICAQLPFAGRQGLT